MAMQDAFLAIENCFATEIMEATALALLAFDVYRGRFEHVSIQTCLALTVSHMLGIFNLEWEHASVKVGILACGTFAGGCATKLLARQRRGDDDFGDDDDLPVPGLSSIQRKAFVYVVPMICGFFVMLFFSHFSLRSLRQIRYEVFIISTQNFINAIGLMPQVMASRTTGFVASAAVRLFFIQGLKEIFEFLADGNALYLAYRDGSVSPQDYCFMASDFVASLVLLDFLYLFFMDKHKAALLAGQQPMELFDDIEAGDCDCQAAVCGDGGACGACGGAADVARALARHGPYVAVAATGALTLWSLVARVVSAPAGALLVPLFLPMLLWASSALLVTQKGHEQYSKVQACT